MSAIVNAIKNFYYGISDFLSSFWGIISSIGSFIIDVFKFIYYIGYTLIDGLARLINYVLGGPVISNVISTFVEISDYIGGPATIFLSSLLLIIIVRIIASFIFKMLRLNINYHSLQYKNSCCNENPNGYDYRKK